MPFNRSWKPPWRLAPWSLEPGRGRLPAPGHPALPASGHRAPPWVHPRWGAPHARGEGTPARRSRTEACDCDCRQELWRLGQRTLARFFLASAPLFALSAALNQVRGRMLRPPGDRTRRVREGGGGRGGAGCAHAWAPRPRPAARAHAELGQMAARLAAGAPRARLAADLAVLARRGGAGVPCGAPGDNRWEGRGVERAALRAATGQPRGLHRRPAPRSVRRAARAAPRSPRQSRRPRPRCLWDLLLAGCSRAGGAGRLQCGQP